MQLCGYSLVRKKQPRSRLQRVSPDLAKVPDTSHLLLFCMIYPAQFQPLRSACRLYSWRWCASHWWHAVFLQADFCKNPVVL